ncbi:hypothetical protein [Pseudomonas sp. AIG]
MRTAEFHIGEEPLPNIRSEEAPLMNSARIPMKLMTATLTLLTLISTQSFALTHEQKVDLEGVRHWLQSAAETGDQKAISSYGSYIAHAPDQVGYPLDLVKGYALISLLKELDGGGTIQDFVQDTLEEIGSKMTSQQIESSKAVAEEWKTTHPPLSFFPEKLGT